MFIFVYRRYLIAYFSNYIELRYVLFPFDVFNRSYTSINSTHRLPGRSPPRSDEGKCPCSIWEKNLYKIFVTTIKHEDSTEERKVQGKVCLDGLKDAKVSP